MKVNFEDLKIGDMVVDSWHKYEGFGIVIKKFGRTVHIRFPLGHPNSIRENGIQIWDYEHVNEFLLHYEG